MDKTVNDVVAFLTEKTGKAPNNVEKRDSGFYFSIEDLGRSAMNLFGESLQDHEEISYCLLETVNEDDVGRYQETMRYEVRPNPKEGFHAEFHYTRKLLGETSCEADVEGTIWLTTPETHEAQRQACDDSYYLRTVEYAFCEIRDMSYLLNIIGSMAEKASKDVQREGVGKILEAINTVNRSFVKG